MDSDNVKSRGVAADSIHKILSFIICIKDTVKTMVLSSRYRFIWTTIPCLTFSTDRLYSKKRRKQKPIDRLSSLPDDLIHNILSFVSIEDAVQTMVLSSRYRYIWTTMPCLDFSTLEYFRRAPDMPQKFIRQFLKRRDSRIDVSSLKLMFGKDTEPYVRKLIMDYAFSHNIQRLDVKWLFENDNEFPLSIFSSPSLKHLSLETGPMRYLLTPKSSNWELPSLTTLYLNDVTFCSDDNCAALLSKCPNLKTLTVKRCEIYGFTSFSIGHPGLSDLSLDGVECFTDVSVLNVVAPQLENLTIRCHYATSFIMHEISAPKLASLACSSFCPLLLNSTDGFPCLKEADILVSYPNDTDAHQIVCMLQQLQHVEFLKLNLEIIELLSSSVELISHQPSPFVNLKSLTIYPEKIYEWGMEGLPNGKDHLSSEVKSYLLDSSPGATFTMFSREEVIAVRDVASAQKLMGELQVLLEQEKASTKTKRKKKGKAETKMQLQIGGNIALIKSCWDKLNLKEQKAHLIISMLESIEELLKKLPATNRAMIEPCFDSLSTEVVIVMRKMNEDIKTECDENEKRLTVGFH